MQTDTPCQGALCGHCPHPSLLMGPLAGCPALGTPSSLPLVPTPREVPRDPSPQTPCSPCRGHRAPRGHCAPCSHPRVQVSLALPNCTALGLHLQEENERGGEETGRERGRINWLLFLHHNFQTFSRYLTSNCKSGFNVIKYVFVN